MYSMYLLSFFCFWKAGLKMTYLKGEKYFNCMKINLSPTKLWLAPPITCHLIALLFLSIWTLFALSEKLVALSTIFFLSTSHRKLTLAPAKNYRFSPSNIQVTNLHSQTSSELVCSVRCVFHLTDFCLLWNTIQREQAAPPSLARSPTYMSQTCYEEL